MSYIEHEDQNFGPLDVPEEFKAQPFVFMGIFDDSWDVGNAHEIVVDELNVANRRLESGELVVCNFGHCSRGCC
jgi:hypothetical protein